MKVGKLKYLPVHQLELGSLQPRTAIDGIALTKLAKSIQAKGVIQPIFVRKAGRGKFEIVAGERRWHAARMAGLRSVPTIVGDVSDGAALAIALIENLHREELRPIDQAVAIQRLIDEFTMTHQEVADTIGKSRAAVTNLLRLLELPLDVQKLVAEGKLDMGHARALLALPSEQRQRAAKRAASERLSVRDVERMVKRVVQTLTPDLFDEVDPQNTDISEWVKQKFGKAIVLRRAKDRRWRLSFNFSTSEELRETMQMVDGLVQHIEQTCKNWKAKSLHSEKCSES